MKGSARIDASPKITVEIPTKTNPAVPERLTTVLDLGKDLGSFEMKSLFNRYFNFHQIDVQLQHNAFIEANYFNRQCGLALMTNGKGSATFDEQHQFDILGGSGLFTFNPAVPESHYFYANKPTQVSYFEINADYFTSLLFEYTSEQPVVNQLKHSVEINRFADHPTSIHPLHYRIISDVINCPLEGKLGNLMLEGSLNQLIGLQFASMGVQTGQGDEISKRDKEVIHAVREYLQTHIDRDHSLLTLSRQFGINQGKLKKAFKQVFGVPVIRYLYDLKMEHARELLNDKGMNITEVASSVGYRYSNHFTTAFKRKFGYCPSHIRQ